jgi:predicted Rossmann fold nucleotide-binding protein DprA/Smf involved in DNA uptake
MPTSLVWLSPGDPAFPPQLAQCLGDKAPAKIASIGNLDILNSKPIALICSIKCPGNIILQAYDLAQRLREAGISVIGGFHSPMERECLRILLRGSQPIVVCPARGLQGMRVPREHQAHLRQGRLLYLSPFSEKVRRPTIDIALQRNQFLGAVAERIFVPYASPSRKTFELCSVLISWKKVVYTFTDEANFGLLKMGAQPLDATNAIPQLSGR